MTAPMTRTAIPVWTTGDRLTKAREWADLTQEEMANQLGIGRRSVVRYEAREHPPRTVVLAYATATGVPVWWLDGGDIEPDGGLGDNMRHTAGYPATLDGILMEAA